MRCKDGKKLSGSDFEKHTSQCTMCANDIEIDEIELSHIVKKHGSLL